MAWVFVVIAAMTVIGIAWFSLSLVTARLENTPSMAVFDIEEATEHVAIHLPSRVASRLSHDDVRILLRWTMTYFRERGVASFGGVDLAAERAARLGRPVVAGEDELVDELLTRAQQEGIAADAVDIVCVVDLTTEYLIAIGAVGPAVDLFGVLDVPADGEDESD